MYTHIKSVQILISLMKQYNVKHIVLSPGTRNTPLAHSVETDDYFTCYSIVDERSAGYFALGIAETLDVPVAVSCTAATATCNYFPAIKEAYERKLQLIALTADQESKTRFQMADQSIDQINMFHGFVRCAIDIPKVTEQRDEWYCNRCINEAFQAMSHHRKGPVQINYHMSYSLEELSTFKVECLPQTRKIERYEGPMDWEPVAKVLKQKNRVLVIAASDYIENESLRKSLRDFTDKYNCVVLADTFSNVRSYDCDRIICPNTLGDVLNGEEIEELCPDLILTFGNVYYSTMKFLLLQYSKRVEHWQIALDGIINDGYRCLTRIYECRPEKFFEEVNTYSDGENDGVYSSLWENQLNRLVYPDLKFTHFEVIRQLCEKLPKNSILHTSVLDSIRISNYVPMHPTVRCFANIGADGIDGALSTLLGQASVDDKLSVLLIGDLSLLYDMSALLTNIPSNVRILVINNYAGAEFHKNFGLERIKTLNRHIAAGHTTKIQQCMALSNASYLKAENSQELEDALGIFLQNNEAPIILEVFTDAATDAQVLKEYWKINKHPGKTTIKQRIYNIIGDANWNRLKHVLGRG